jgi:hypothetical protein
MPVNNALPSLRTRLGKPGAADHVIQPPLAEDQQGRGRIPFGLLGNCEVAAELLLAEAVVKLDLLLLVQRNAVVRLLAAAGGHAGRIFLPLGSANCTRVLEDHKPEAAIDSCLWTGVTTHPSLSFCWL